MARKCVGRRSISFPFFVVLAIVIAGSIVCVSEPAFAEEVMQPPSSSAYVDGSAFSSADMDYGLTSGKTPQAVYFGTNGDSGIYGGSGTNGDSAQRQKWWIAGHDANGLVLMCDPRQPLKAEQQFETTTGKTRYESAFGSYEAVPANELYPNHYGASDIRSLLSSFATDSSRFTSAEQAMMKKTTVYTYDFANSTTYSTTDTLYLAAGCYNSKEVTVGQNQVDSSKAGNDQVDTSKTGNEQVHNGLKVDLKRDSLYGSPFTDRTNSCNFWTRSAADDSDVLALHAIPSIQVFAGSTGQYREGVVPAFAMDPSNVLFASAAGPGTDFAEIDEENAMTFRCDGADRIRSTATFTHDSVAVDFDDSDPVVYLYVQGSDDTGDWVSSHKIDHEVDFPSSYIHRGANLTNCKVWLEVVEDNITYAKPASFTGAFPPPLYGIVDPPASMSYPYTGSEITGVKAGLGYRVYGWIGGTSVGEYIVDAELEKGYVWSDQTIEPKKIVWSIVKASNPMVLKAKTATVKRSAVRKKAQKLARSKVLTFTRSAAGKVTYTKVGGSGKLSIAKTTGKITVKKKTKKGTYKIKVKVRAAGDDCYEALSRTVTIKVRVK